MSGLFGKLVAHFMNEVIVKTLANSRWFQRFALRTDTFIQNKKTAATVLKDDALKKGSEKLTASAADKSLEFGGIDFGKFIHEFKEEIGGKGSTTNGKPPTNIKR
jgi:hypothetical protein